MTMTFDTAVRVAAALGVLMLCASPAAGQGPDPDAPVPPGATRTIMELQYRTEPLAGAIRDLDVRETPLEIRIEMPADVLFDFDKADIRPDAARVLGQAAELIEKHGRRGILIEGHTDGKGMADYNQRLSARRAEAVKRWFQARPALARLAMQTRGLGATKPVAPNTKPDGSDNPEGRQKNRRVEIVIAKGGS